MKPEESPARLPTYQVGLLHSRAYRNLNNFMTDQLAAIGLTPPKWALLGILYDSGAVPLHVLADALGVSPAFVSRLIKELASDEMVHVGGEVIDQRTKAAVITRKGRDRVDRMEIRLRKNLREYTAEVGSEDLQAYLKVLRAFADLD